MSIRNDSNRLPSLNMNYKVTTKKKSDPQSIQEGGKRVQQDNYKINEIKSIS